MQYETQSQKAKKSKSQKSQVPPPPKKKQYKYSCISRIFAGLWLLCISAEAPESVVRYCISTELLNNLFRCRWVGIRSAQYTSRVIHIVTKAIHAFPRVHPFSPDVKSTVELHAVIDGYKFATSPRRVLLPRLAHVSRSTNHASRATTWAVAFGFHALFLSPEEICESDNCKKKYNTP